MNILALDTETTTWNKGHWADSRNKLVCYSICPESDEKQFPAYAARWGSGNVQALLNKADLVVGFNYKFDLHWLKKEGIVEHPPVWDCQIAEFILSHQTNRFPSLNDTASKYGLPVKLDIVKTEYWEKGVQTDEIPWEILSEYARWDAELTLAVYHKQIALMTPEQIKLCKLQCMDLMVLQEMEANGILFDEQLCHERSKELDDQISEIKRTLAAYYPGVPINFGSTDHLSAFLYGGIVKEDAKEHIGFFKTGEKAGQPRYKNVVIEHSLPRLFSPLKGSELKKEGMFATDESTLRKLKGNKKLVEKLLLLAKVEKMNGTYYQGIPKLRKEMNWPENMLHGNFNQTQAATGRLSSSRPNLQNFSTDLQDIFISRYT